MKNSLIALSTCALLSGFANAQANTQSQNAEYQFFSALSYTNAKDFDIDIMGLSAQYYFSNIQSRGPLSEFDYLITTSNIAGNFSRINTDFDDRNAYGLSGQYYYGNLLIGASYADSGISDSSALQLGYLLSDGLLVDVQLFSDDGPIDAQVSATYQHDLADGSYIGVTLSADDELFNTNLSSKYFTPLGGDRYLSVNAQFSHIDEFDNYWLLGADYYFSKFSSLGLSTNDDLAVIRAQHFFSQHFSISGFYNHAYNDLGDQFTLNVTYQF